MGSSASISGGQSERVEWISKIPCFSTLNDAYLASLATKITVFRFSKGEKIITEGHVGNLFGILVEGTVQISAIGPTAEEIVLCNQSPGFYFGEAAIIGNTTTTATITALEDVTVFGLRSRELQQLTVEMPEVKESLLRTVSYRLKQNLLTIPFFAQLRDRLEQKKIFKVLGAFDLLSTLFEVEAVDNKSVIFNVGDVATKFYVICEGCVRISTVRADTDFMLNMLKKNDVFGEIALLEGTTRTATARAFEPSLLLSITKAKFQKLLQVFPALRDVMEPLLRIRTANTLKKVVGFKNLTADKKEIIGGMMTFRNFNAGEVMCREGALGGGLFVLITGRVQATMVDRSTGETVMLSTMEDEAVMGEISLLSGCPRTACLTALESCLVLCLSAKRFRRFVPVAPEMLDDLVLIAQERRRYSIAADAENVIRIPNIGADPDSKLYLYALLRSDPNAPVSNELEEDDDDRNAPSREPHASLALTVEALASENNSVMDRNEQKRAQIAELRAMITDLANRLETTAVNTVATDGQGDIVDPKLIEAMEKGRPGREEKTKNDNNNNNNNNNNSALAGGGATKRQPSPASVEHLPPQKASLSPKGKGRSVDRRNSWQAATTYDSTKEDLVRILKGVYRQGITRGSATTTIGGDSPWDDSLCGPTASDGGSIQILMGMPTEEKNASGFLAKVLNNQVAPVGVVAGGAGGAGLDEGRNVERPRRNSRGERLSEEKEVSRRSEREQKNGDNNNNQVRGSRPGSSSGGS